MPEVKHVIKDCIGCGSCAAIDPKHWVMKGDKACLKNAKPDKEGNFVLKIKEEDSDIFLEAAQTCPTDCIKVKK